MKRLISVILALCLLLLCGCGAAESEADESDAYDAAIELQPLLSAIRTRMQPGTAGSSLTAQQLAVQLLDWSMQTGAGRSQVRAAVGEYLESLDESERSEFAQQMGAVQSAVDRLLGENSEALMEDIGGTEGTLWPWKGAPRDLLKAMFSAAGAGAISP